MEIGNTNYHVKTSNLNQLIGKWTGPGHNKQTILLAPSTGILHLREETGWGRHTSKTSDISTRCCPSYRVQAQVEQSPEWIMILSIKKTGYEDVMNQVSKGKFATGHRNPQLIK